LGSSHVSWPMILCVAIQKFYFIHQGTIKHKFGLTIK
jgi:hypothetical protein